MAISVPEEKLAAGATAPTSTAGDAKNRIVEYMLWLKRNGYRDSSVYTLTLQLRILTKRGADLENPENIKQVIALQPWAESRKLTASYAYGLFLKMHGKTWEQPIYKPVHRVPFLATEGEIDALIAGSGRKTAAYLQLLKESAMRAGEANQLRWADLDTERRTVSITPEKDGNPRIIDLSAKCVAMLNALPKKSEKIFGGIGQATMRSTFINTRKRLARKLDNPRLLEIHFHSLRHWRATTLYHETKDPFFVRDFLGHKSMESTSLYVHLEKALYRADADNFTCKVARTQEEMLSLIEGGFDFVTQKDGLAYFRKRR